MLTLWDFCSKSNIDLVLAQEPLIDNDNLVVGLPNNFESYMCPPKKVRKADGSTMKKNPRAAIFAKMELPLTFDSSSSSLDSTVAILASSSPILFSSMYFDRRADPLSLLSPLTQHDLWNFKRNILGVDTNAKSLLWNSKKTDKRGSIFEAFLATQGLSIVNTKNHEPTFDGGKVGCSWIDCTMCGDNIFDMVDRWQILEEDSASDHAYIYFHVDLSNNETRSLQRLIQKYDARRMDTQRFEEVLKLKILNGALDCSLVSRDDIDQCIARMTDILWEAFADCTPMKKTGRRRAKAWWSKELGVLRKRLQALKRKRHRGAAQQEAYWTARREFQKLKRKSRRKSWRQFCTEVSDPFGVIYKSAKKSPSLPPSTIKDNTGRIISDPQESVSQLLDDFFPDDDPELDTLDQAALRQSVEEFKRKAEVLAKISPEQPFTHLELERALYSLGLFKSPGHDMILGIVLRHCPKLFLPYLLRLYNACLRLKYFPTSWKRDHTISLGKPLKTDPSNYKSFRPISLLCILGKILEKLMFFRGRWLTESEGWISPKQFGFRQGKSREQAAKG